MSKIQNRLCSLQNPKSDASVEKQKPDTSVQNLKSDPGDQNPISDTIQKYKSGH